MFEPLERSKTAVVISYESVEKPLIGGALILAFIELAFDQLPQAIDAFQGELDICTQFIPADIETRVHGIDSLFDTVHTIAQPAHVLTERVKLSAEPIDLSVKPTDLLVEPIDLSVKPTDPLVEPIDLSVKPTDLLVEPIDLLTECVHCLAEPVNFRFHSL